MANAGQGWVLVTGASSGIGKELARVFATQGYDVVLVARDGARLEELAGDLARVHGVKTFVATADLAAEGGVRALSLALGERLHSLQVLVNNAGVGMLGPFAEADEASLLAMLRLNVVALTELTRLVLPSMRARGSGQILNVASTAAFFPGPFMAGYYASKAYVLSLSVALSTELAGSGITVTALCPGPTHSGFADRAGMARSRLFHGGGVMDSAEVARVGYEGLRAGRVVVVPGLRNRLLAASARLGPRTLAARIVRALHEPASDR
jgi:uncharacterized protein